MTNKVFKTNKSINQSKPIKHKHKRTMNTKTYLISIKTNSINKKIINTIIDLINIKK
ncbi:hypothetical protein B10328_03900 [Campylobacter coli]|nr:hypothetical protein B10328_03900 [Campylobacter coli]